MVGADGGDDAGAGGGCQKKSVLSLVVAWRGKTLNVVVVEDGGGAQENGGALVARLG